MSDDAEETTDHEHDGRSARIDTGYYEVQVWGDPDDEFETVLEAADRLADRALADVESLDERLDTTDKEYHR